MTKLGIELADVALKLLGLGRVLALGDDGIGVCRLQLLELCALLVDLVGQLRVGTFGLLLGVGLLLDLGACLADGGTDVLLCGLCLVELVGELLRRCRVLAESGVRRLEL